MSSTSTKIMCTLTPERENYENVSRLVAAGMSAVRINSAFATPESIKRSVTALRSVLPSMKILMDTKGPEVRTTSVAAPLIFRQGDNLTFLPGDKPSTRNAVYLRLPHLPSPLPSDAEIILDDGAVCFKVIESNTEALKASCIKEGVLDSCKTFVIPGIDMPYLPAVSHRDRLNIEAAEKTGIDMIAHSFVRNAADVEAVRELIKGTGIKLFSKIECRQGVENFHEILDASDGILVARGDLGAEMGLIELPALQHRFATLTRQAHKPLILATNLLGSMTSNPVPTRAEVNDVALAVIQGFDWLLLTGETARGDYAAECVDTLSQLINSLETNGLKCLIK